MLFVQGKGGEGGLAKWWAGNFLIDYSSSFMIVIVLAESLNVTVSPSCNGADFC